MIDVVLLRVCVCVCIEEWVRELYRMWRRRMQSLSSHSVNIILLPIFLKLSPPC